MLLNVIFIHATSVPGQAALPLWQIAREISQSKNYGVYQFDSEDEFASVVPLAIHDLREFAVEILNGDTDLFRKYEKTHRESWANYYIEQALKNKYQQLQPEFWMNHYKERFSINREE
jgi:hypothetical protein